MYLCTCMIQSLFLLSSSLLFLKGMCNYMSLLLQIQVIEDDKANKANEPFITGVRGQAPPLVTTNFHVKDQGKVLLGCIFHVDKRCNTSLCAA